jgi:hypothetical protein
MLNNSLKNIFQSILMGQCFSNFLKEKSNDISKVKIISVNILGYIIIEINNEIKAFYDEELYLLIVDKNSFNQVVSEIVGKEFEIRINSNNTVIHGVLINSPYQKIKDSLPWIRSPVIPLSPIRKHNLEIKILIAETSKKDIEIKQDDEIVDNNRHKLMDEIREFSKNKKNSLEENFEEYKLPDINNEEDTKDLDIVDIISKSIEYLEMDEYYNNNGI